MSSIFSVFFMTIVLVNSGLSKYKNSGHNGATIKKYDYAGKLNEYFFEEIAYKLNIHQIQFLYSKELAKEYYGFISDSIRAVDVAESVLVPIYGFNIYKQRPYQTNHSNGKWIVEGSLSPSRYVYDDNWGFVYRVSIGGVFKIEIREKDGKILSVHNGK